MKKYKQRVNVFKVKHCGSSLLTSNRKNEFEKKLLISKRNRKRKSAVKVVADGVYTAKFKTISLTKVKERERLALMAADI
jgi:hypothetical protein